MMKKFLVVMVCTLSCTFAHAYKLGEHVRVDNIPSIVIYVDSTGEHGLFMSATACHDKKEVQKVFELEKEIFDNDSAAFVQQGFEDAYLSMPSFDYIKYNNTKMKRQKKLVLLRNKTTPYGKENSRIIAEFCKENNVDINEYFPEQVWASQLGEGWFIPGNAELELFREEYMDFLLEEFLGECEFKYIYEHPEMFYKFFPLLSLTTMLSSTLMISDWTNQMDNCTKIEDFDILKKSLAIAMKANKSTAMDAFYVAEFSAPFHVLDGLFSYVKLVMNDIKTNKIKSFDLVAVKEF
jgi:hypothetical protein